VQKRYGERRFGMPLPVEHEMMLGGQMLYSQYRSPIFSRFRSRRILNTHAINAHAHVHIRKQSLSYKYSLTNFARVLAPGILPNKREEIKSECRLMQSGLQQ